VLYLGDNQMSGSIPAWLGSIASLTHLQLAHNAFTGTIPTELGDLSNLTYLFLENNALSGNIPSALQNLPNLRQLNLSYNNLTGSVPTWVRFLDNLQRLDLSDNSLTGTVTGQATGPTLSGENSGSQGDFLDFTPLTNLEYLDLSGNQLSGAIPSILGVLTSLEDLYLNSNMLSGEIPTSLMNLTVLDSADIGYNALYTDDPSLQAFLDTVDPDWDETQTVVPEDVYLVYLDASTIEVRWTPITYQSDPGGYRVLYSLFSGGPYTLYDTTADKTISEMEITLPNPSIVAYLVVQTRTEPHSYNDNTVDSEYSEEVVTGNLPDINVRYRSMNFADGSSTNLGTRPANLIKNTQFVFTIENLGASPVLLTGAPLVVLYGPDADKFMISAQPVDDTLGVGESTTFTLEADPSWADLPGGSTETVTFGIGIANNDPDENPYNFTITVTVQY
jgi:hypothetical protein